MLEPQQSVESWLVETVHRTIYLGNDIKRRLKVLLEQLGDGDDKEFDFIKTWVMELNNDSVYRARDVQNNLLSLWSFLAERVVVSEPA